MDGTAQLALAGALRDTGQYKESYELVTTSLEDAMQALKAARQRKERARYTPETVEALRFEMVIALFFSGRWMDLDKASQHMISLFKKSEKKAARVGINPSLIMNIIALQQQVQDWRGKARKFSSQYSVAAHPHLLTKLRHLGEEDDHLDAETDASDVVIISQYSDDYLYRRKADILRGSCARLRLHCDIVALPIQRDQEDYTFQSPSGGKADFIKSMMKKHQKPILYVDSDMEFLRVPSLFFPVLEESKKSTTSLHPPLRDIDVAFANAFDLSPAMRSNLSEDDKKKDYFLAMVGQIIFFNTTKEARRVLECWVTAQNFNNNVHMVCYP